METKNKSGCGCGGHVGAMNPVPQAIFSRPANNPFRRNTVRTHEIDNSPIDLESIVKLLSAKGFSIRKPTNSEFDVFTSNVLLEFNYSYLGQINLNKVLVSINASKADDKAMLIPTSKGLVILPIFANNQISTEKSFVLFSTKEEIFITNLKGNVSFVYSIKGKDWGNSREALPNWAAFNNCFIAVVNDQVDQDPIYALFFPVEIITFAAVTCKGLL